MSTRRSRERRSEPWPSSQYGRNDEIVTAATREREAVDEKEHGFAVNRDQRLRKGKAAPAPSISSAPNLDAWCLRGGRRPFKAWGNRACCGQRG